jgi:hypothetical protein
LLIQGGPFLRKSWLWTGDFVYHRALIAEILNGELLPGGPYAGLPAFYSPLEHYLAASIAALLRIDPLAAVQVLSVAAAPGIPLAAWYLSRTLKLDRSVALAAAFFATFGGGLKLTEDRVWVDALFTGQHNFFPLLPRDPAFLLLMLGFAWVYRGLIDEWRWGAPLAGLAFGLMVLVHTQTALFAAPIVALFAGLCVAIEPRRTGRAVRMCAVIGGLTLAVSSFWWIWMLASLVRSGSFGVHMPAYRVPVKIDLAELPLELGVFLPLGLIGLVLTVQRLVRWRDSASLLLMVWWLPPLLLAIFRPSEFPGGDTFFPRRLWQLASQPLQIMAAVGLVVGVLRPLLAGRVGASPIRRAFAGALLATALVLGGVPGSWGSWQRVGEFYNDTSFADTEYDLDGGFRYARFLAERARSEGPHTVLAPTPDATLVWYYAGEKVVYLYPTAAIKLAFDVRRMTGFGVDEREADLLAAFGGRPDELTRVAEKYGAAYAVLRRSDLGAGSGERLALVDLPATALRSGRNAPKTVDTNHYEWLPLGEGDSTRFEFSSPIDGSATVALRARRRSKSPRLSARLLVNGVEYPVAEAETPLDSYAEISREVAVRRGQNEVRFQTASTIELARFTAYVAPREALSERFAVVYEDPSTVVLAPR